MIATHGGDTPITMVAETGGMDCPRCGSGLTRISLNGEFESVYCEQCRFADVESDHTRASDGAETWNDALRRFRTANAESGGSGGNADTGAGSDPGGGSGRDGGGAGGVETPDAGVGGTAAQDTDADDTEPQDDDTDNVEQNEADDNVEQNDDTNDAEQNDDTDDAETRGDADDAESQDDHAAGKEA